MATVERTRHKFVAGGLDLALIECPRPGQLRKLDGKDARVTLERLYPLTHPSFVTLDRRKIEIVVTKELK